MPFERVVRDGTRDGRFGFALGAGSQAFAEEPVLRVELHKLAEIEAWHRRPPEDRGPVLHLHVADRGRRAWGIWPEGAWPPGPEQYLTNHPRELWCGIEWTAARAGVGRGELLEALRSGRWAIIWDFEAWFRRFLSAELPDRVEEWDRAWLEALPLVAGRIPWGKAGTRLPVFIVDSDLQGEAACRLSCRLVLCVMQLPADHRAAEAIAEAYPKTRGRKVWLCWAARLKRGRGAGGIKAWLASLLKADALYAKARERSTSPEQLAAQVSDLAKRIWAAKGLRHVDRVLVDRAATDQVEDIESEAIAAGWEKLSPYDIFVSKRGMLPTVLDGMIGAARRFRSRERRQEEWTVSRAESGEPTPEPADAASAELEAALARLVDAAGLSTQEADSLAAVVAELAADPDSDVSAACERASNKLGRPAAALRAQFYRIRKKLVGKRGSDRTN